MKIISIKDIIAYRLKKESSIEVGEEVELPTEYGSFRLIPFRQPNGLEHMALIKGTWKEDEPVLVRVHRHVLQETSSAVSVATVVNNYTQHFKKSQNLAEELFYI